MASTQNIAIAAIAGVIVLGGAAYLEKDKLGLSFGGSSIRSVDFRNSPVEVVGTACADPQLTNAGVTKLPLHDGTYQLGQYQFELVGDVRYGDVSGHTGDSNSEKAVFVGSCSTSGKTSQVLFVYGTMDGKPERLAFNDLSASGNTLVQSYSVGDGAIQVKANQGNPPALVTLTYALLNGNLVNLNPAAAQPAVQTVQPGAQTVADTNVNPTSSESLDATNPASQSDRVDFETFHDELKPYGQWVQHPRWGFVWHPTQVSADFRPYRDGHWEDTDEYGTVWVSDYSWGDIPFHYGRWGYDPSYGWLWQPGYTWSPAWVVWREGAGNIGWLPIPPGYYDGTAEFVDDWDGWYGYRDLYGAALDAAAFDALWSFIPADDIYAPSIAVDVIAPSLYVGFIGGTVGWTRFGLVHGHFFNRAIDRDRFRAAFGHPLRGGGRHDFLAHHGPIVGAARGRMIAAHERSLGHAAPGSTHVGPHPGFVAGVHHNGLSHSFGHTGISHAGIAHNGFGSSRHGFASSQHHAGFGQRTGFGGGERTGFGGSQRTGFGGAERSSVSNQRTGFGGGERTGFGGGQRNSFGGGAQRPAFGGGSYQQRPSFGNGGMSRPAMGGGFARPAMGGGSRPPAPSNNNRHH